MKESGSQVPPQGLVFLIPHSFLKHTRSLWFNDAVTITCSHIIIFSHHFQLFCFPTINFFGPFFFKLFFFAFLETWISLSVPCRPQWRSTNLHLEKQKQKKKKRKENFFWVHCISHCVQSYYYAARNVVISDCFHWCDVLTYSFPLPPSARLDADPCSPRLLTPSQH